MLRKALPLTLLLALTPLASAQTNENQIRSSTSIYSAQACGFGTVTAIPTDVILFRDANGREITSLTRTAGYWLARPYSGPIYGIDPGANGNYSIRFYFGWFGSVINNGTIEIIRNGVVLDRDRLFRC